MLLERQTPKYHCLTQLSTVTSQSVTVLVYTALVIHTLMLPDCRQCVQSALCRNDAGTLQWSVDEKMKCFVCVLRRCKHPLTSVASTALHSN